MNGFIAQIVALTCYANAAIRGFNWPQFFPNHSTSQFCDFVKFMGPKRLIGLGDAPDIAATPGEWLRILGREAKAVRLITNHGTWKMEVAARNDSYQSWTGMWEVWNQNAPERRIWRVTYHRKSIVRCRPVKSRPLHVIKSDFASVLTDAHRFAAQVGCRGFAEAFASGLEALRDPKADVGYHKDLFIPGTLLIDAECILRAVMSSWVFGGMGSWNDLWFDGADGKDYERVTAELWRILNEAVPTAASSAAKSLP